MKRYYPSEVKKLCIEEYIQLAQTFGERTRQQARHEWYHQLTERERTLICDIANGCVQHVYNELEAEITRLQQEIEELSNLDELDFHIPPKSERAVLIKVTREGRGKSNFHLDNDLPMMDEGGNW